MLTTVSVLKIHLLLSNPWVVDWFDVAVNANGKIIQNGKKNAH